MGYNIITMISIVKIYNETHDANEEIDFQRNSFIPEYSLMSLSICVIRSSVYILFERQGPIFLPF